MHVDDVGRLRLYLIAREDRQRRAVYDVRRRFAAARRHRHADQKQDSMHSHVTLRVGAIRVTEWR